MLSLRTENKETEVRVSALGNCHLAHVFYTVNLYYYVKTEAARTPLAFSDCDLLSQNDHGGRVGRTHFIVHGGKIIFFIKNRNSVGIILSKVDRDQLLFVLKLL